MNIIWIAVRDRVMGEGKLSGKRSTLLEASGHWVCGNELDDTFVKLCASNVARLFFFRGGINEPVGIAFDGTSVWVANFGDPTVSKF
jgi:hypothetical protein